MQKSLKQTLKQTISWGISIPAAFFVLCDWTESEYWWIQFVAIGVLLAILQLNHLINLREFYQDTKQDLKELFYD